MKKGSKKPPHSVEHRKRSGCTPALPYPQADNNIVAKIFYGIQIKPLEMDGAERELAVKK